MFFKSHHALLLLGSLLVAGVGMLKAEDPTVLAEGDHLLLEEDDGFAVSPDLASDAIGTDSGMMEVDQSFHIEGLDGPESGEEYREYLNQRFIRPGIAESGSDLIPFRASRGLAKGLRVRTEAGFGYDSNSLLNDGALLNGGGVGSKFQQSLANRGGAVSWFRLNVGYSNGVDGSDGRRFIYGVDIGGDLISYESGRNAYGRGSAEPYFSPYIGIIGAKTTVRLSGRYAHSEGNYLHGDQFRRESPAAESDTYGGTLSISRNLDRGTLGYIIDHQDTDFANGTGLNDQSSFIGDLSYLHDPAGMPKTSLGGGLRHGVYDTQRNPDTTFIEPSLRFSYRPTVKTTLDGRIGYSFRDHDTALAADEDGVATYAIGSNWAITERTRLRIEGYRDFRPSYVSAGESFTSHGVRTKLSYAVPNSRWSVGAHLDFERADYYSDFKGIPGSGRADEFYRAGVSAGHPLNLFKRIETNVSIFYDYTDNESNDLRANFDRHFTGIRFTGTL